MTARNRLVELTIDTASRLLHYPKHMLQHMTIIGLAFEEDGEIVAGGGVYLHEGRWYGFFDGAEALRRYPVYGVKTIKELLAILQQNGINEIYAGADPSIAGAERLLAALGFEPTGEDDVHLKGRRYIKWQ